MLRTPVPPAVSAPAASALAASLGLTFYVVGRLRRGRRKPLHPDGAVLPGTLLRDGAPTSWGAQWLDATGEHAATVRLSRSAGLRPPLPDVLGIAVRVQLDGRDADLLMSSAGRGRVGRHVLRPRVHPGRGLYTTLLPYLSPAGPVLIAAQPTPPRDLSPRPARLAEQLRSQPMRFTLLCAAPSGEWQPFGTLEVGGPVHEVAGMRPDLEPHPAPGRSPDGSISYDPVLNPLPGLRMPALLAAVRARTYAQGRRSRGLPG